MPSASASEFIVVAVPTNPHRLQEYGTAVCPTCGKPFARHLWAPNLGVGKFDRCPHCKKWSMVGRATPDQVRDAIILLDDNQPKAAAEESAETLQKRLDNSRYDS